ncbi:hypothetical protein [Mycobacteroides abscessus]|uniref:hypothetical protein n=1 Tax=Mycobacteroides abscessus TaxID=36809 RepID=UPI00103DFCE9|nr:hypothetical protein [Mycobacteroides abscessus]
MSNYDDLAETSAFLAGRDVAREMRRDGVGWGADDGHRMVPRGLHPSDEAAWLRGWRSAWE